MSGRKKPYTVVGLARLKCVRCGAKATQQWSACADNNIVRPICTECDIDLNQLALEFMGDPHVGTKMALYRKKLGVPE